jgi:hypothetical protein
VAHIGSDIELHYTDTARRMARESRKGGFQDGLEAAMAKAVDFRSGDSYKEGEGLLWEKDDD